MYVSMYVVMYLSKPWSKTITILKEKFPVVVPNATLNVFTD
jgi:hypothetical protein